MFNQKTVLSQQEKKWILARRVTRLTDDKEVQIYPMGAERYLSSALAGSHRGRYNIKADIEGKDVLVIPGFGNSAFLFAEAGANSLTVYDKDPVTIAWIKAFKLYYHYRGKDKTYPSVGDLMSALTQWYPPLLSLPFGKYRTRLFWLLQPNLLRRVYIHYMLSLVQQALQSKTSDNFELDKNIQFQAKTIETLTQRKQSFDTAFVPYLLGVENGIENEKEIVIFLEQLFNIIPSGRILVNPSRNSKEFYMAGKRYFVTTKHENIQSIPELRPYFKAEDRNWFRTQGLAVFSSQI